MTLHEIELHPLTVYGVQGNALIPLGQFKLIDVTKRDETCQEILERFASEEKVIFGNTLIHTEHYDAFRIF